jgi:hypothetical protein
MNCWFCNSEFVLSKDAGLTCEQCIIQGMKLHYSNSPIIPNSIWVTFKIENEFYEAYWQKELNKFKVFRLNFYTKIIELNLDQITDINPTNLIEKVSNYICFI